MSLKSTAEELRERADGLRRSHDNEDLAQHLRAMAEELDEITSDLRLVVYGGAANQDELDQAIRRLSSGVRLA